MKRRNLSILFLFLLVTAASAKTTTWNSTTGGDWTSSSNWDNGVPVEGDDVILASDQSAAITGVPTIALLSIQINGSCNLTGSGNGNTITITGTGSVISAGETVGFGFSEGGRMNLIIAYGANLTIEGILIMNNNLNGGSSYYSMTVNGTLTFGAGGYMETSDDTDDHTLFYLNSGATIVITSSDGIASTGNVGNIRIGRNSLATCRSFSTGANYNYQGSGQQETGSGLPNGTITGAITVGDLSELTLTNHVLSEGALTVNGILNIDIKEATFGSFSNYGGVVISSTSGTPNTYGSFIVTGTIAQNTGSTVTYNLQMRAGSDPGADLQLFSSPVRNVTNSDPDVELIYGWSEEAGKWSWVEYPNYVTSYIGYLLRETLTSNGMISFTGTMNDEDFWYYASSPYANDSYIDGSEPNYDGRTFAAGRDNSTNYGGGGWNLIGNPFTSAISVSEFIEANYSSTPSNSNFDPNYVAVYLYDGINEEYRYIARYTGWSVPDPAGTELVQSQIQVGQAFFVLAMNDGSLFNFFRSMQEHASSAVKWKSTTEAKWPGLQIKAGNGNYNSFTTIVFNNDMSIALDPGYDVGLLNSGKEIELYSTLINDNGTNFTRQALPLDDCDANAIALGIDCPEGGIITFSANTQPIKYFTYFLEDKETGIFVDLSKSSYTINLPENTMGTGRFFLRVTTPRSIYKKIPEPELRMVRIWSGGRKVFIKGPVDRGARVEIFDLKGNSLMECNLGDQIFNEIEVKFAQSGVFIVKVSDGSKIYTQKIVLL